MVIQQSSSVVCLARSAAETSVSCPIVFNGSPRSSELFRVAQIMLVALQAQVPRLVISNSLVALVHSRDSGDWRGQERTTGIRL